MFVDAETHVSRRIGDRTHHDIRLAHTDTVELCHHSFQIFPSTNKNEALERLWA